METGQIDIGVDEKNLPVVAALFSEFAETANSFETEADLRAFLKRELVKPDEVFDRELMARVGRIKKLADRTV